MQVTRVFPEMMRYLQLIHSPSQQALPSEVMKSYRFTKVSFIVLLSSLVLMCQDEKYTDKGIPEVDIISIKLIEGGGALFEGRILLAGAFCD